MPWCYLVLQIPDALARELSPIPFSFWKFSFPPMLPQYFLETSYCSRRFIYVRLAFYRSRKMLRLNDHTGMIHLSTKI